MGRNRTIFRADRGWVLVVIGIGACGDAVDDVAASRPDGALAPTRPDASLQPTGHTVGEARPVFVRRLSDGVDDAAWIPDGRTIGISGGRLQVVGATTFSPGPAEAPLTGVAQLGDGLLVGDARGVHALVGERLDASPIADVLGGRRITAIELSAAEIWLATPDGPWVWKDGSTFRVDVGSVWAADARLVYGALVDDLPGVWVLSSGQVFGLAFDGMSAHMQPTNEVDAVDLAVDGTGTLWVVRNDGRLRSRSSVGVWVEHERLTDVHAVEAHTFSDDLWLTTGLGPLLHRGVEFIPLVGLGPGEILGPAGPGRALFSTTDGLELISVELQAAIVGLEPGEVVVESRRVEVLPAHPAAVDGVEVRLDGRLVSLDAPWFFDLDPALLEDGQHRLSVRVTYDDGTPDATSELGFVVSVQGPPTWRDDVQPLSDAKCSLCHGSRGSARRLEIRSQWVDAIDAIVVNLDNARMPLPPYPPFTPTEVGIIKAWRDAGFPE